MVSNGKPSRSHHSLSTVQQICTSQQGHQPMFCQKVQSADCLMCDTKQIFISLLPQVIGNLVQWQKWQFRVGFNYREGVVLHNIGYQDGGSLRPILHRMSLAEMYSSSNFDVMTDLTFQGWELCLVNCAVSVSPVKGLQGQVHFQV